MDEKNTDMTYDFTTEGAPRGEKVFAFFICTFLLIVATSCSQREPIYTPSKEYISFFKRVDSLRVNLLSSHPNAISSKSRQYDSLRIAIAEEYASISPKKVSAPFTGRLLGKETGSSVLYSTQHINNLLGSITKENNYKHSTECFLTLFNARIEEWRWLLKFVNEDESMGLYDLVLPKQKFDCKKISAMTCDVLKTFGFICEQEYTPLWVDRPRPHYWCVALDSTGVLRPFTPPDNNLMEDWESDLQYMGKAFGYSGSRRRPLLKKWLGKYDAVPPELNLNFIHDHTARYRPTVSLTIPVSDSTKHNVAYLCFYSNNEQSISAVAWGKINHKSNTAVFEQVPIGILFFLAYYDDKGYHPFSYPFRVSQEGSIVPVMPNGNLTSMTLLRKYPVKRKLNKMVNNLNHAILLGSMSKAGPYDTLFSFHSVSSQYVQQETISKHQEYLFYTLKNSYGESLNLAEFQLLGKANANSDCPRPLPLPILPDIENHDDRLVVMNGELLDTGNSVNNVMDGDVLSYTGASKLIIEFAVPTDIVAIRFLPRNANNIVSIGDTYTLFYYDDGWQEHSSLYATTNYLVFDDVPDGCLYLLVDDTEGNEQLPFEYKNDTQLFVNI